MNAKLFFASSAAFGALLYAGSAFAQAQFTPLTTPPTADVQAPVVAPAPVPAPPANPPAATTPASAVPNGVITSLPNSDTNYLDDRLVWSNDINALSIDGKTPYCLPAKTRVLGRKSTLDTLTFGSPDAANQSTVTSAKSYLPVVLDPKGRWLGFGEKQTAQSCARSKSGDPVPMGYDALGKFGPLPNYTIPDGTAAAVPEGTLVYISGDVVASADYRAGFDYGLLAVPFKIQMTGKQSFSGSATLGGFVGYRIPFTTLGLEVSPVLFAGASNITVPTAPGSASTTETAAGFSYGGGFVTRIKDSVQVGLVVGFDHVDSAQPYAYNDKPWLSVEIGYSFAQ